MKEVLAVYETQGTVHQVIGSPVDVYVQLDILCDILGDFHLVSVNEIGGTK
jgi:hypothetical protein